MKTRYNAIIKEDIELLYKFRKNFILFDVYQWNKIEIYKGDPANDPNALLIQTINPADITRISQGVYSYTMNAVIEPGAYYDKQYLIPEIGMPEFTDIEVVQVFDINYDGGSGDISYTRIRGSAIPNENVYAFLHKDVYYNNVYIPVKEYSTTADSEGIWFLDLPDTQNMEIGSYYHITVGQRRFNVVVPIYPLSNNIVDLPIFGDGLDIIPITPPKNISFSLISSSGFTVSWENDYENILGFRVYIDTVNIKPATSNKEVDKDTLSVLIDGLTANTLYYVWLVSYNQMGESEVVTATMTTLI